MKLKTIIYQIVEELKHTLKSENLDPDFIYKFNHDKFEFNISRNIDKKETKTTTTVQEKLISIEKAVSKCKKCNLHSTRINTVFGAGDIDARVMFIGEGPGEQEDKTGIPFVGPAGQLLTKIIENGMKLKREEVYLANIVKCRPPRNRNPENNEVANCIGYLFEQIKLVNPELIILLGSVALRNLMPAYNGITKYRGKDLILKLDKKHQYPVIATYHPSYLLRNPNKKRETWEDIKKAIYKLGL